MPKITTKSPKSDPNERFLQEKQRIVIKSADFSRKTYSCTILDIPVFSNMPLLTNDILLLRRYIYKRNHLRRFIDSIHVTYGDTESFRIIGTITITHSHRSMEEMLNA
jgi:hypothetical protein